MNSTEQKKKINERKELLEQRISQRFKEVRIRETRFFRKDDGLLFTLSRFPGENALVIEYAESYDDALLNRLEDGDRFYLEDLNEEAMFQSMIQEIEQ